MKNQSLHKNFFSYIKRIIVLLSFSVLGIILYFGMVFHFKEKTYARGIQDILSGQVSEENLNTINLPEVHTGIRPEEKVNHIIYTVIEIILGIAGFVAVIFLVIGGSRYTMSAGDDDMINGAKSMIIYALSGLAVIIFSYAILTNIISVVEVAEKN